MMVGRMHDFNALQNIFRTLCLGKDSSGRRIFKGISYKKTIFGEIENSVWYKLAKQIIIISGNEQFLERVKDYCREHCAWMHKEQEIEEYAIECVMNEAYMAWEDFETTPIETTKWFFCF